MSPRTYEVKVWSLFCRSTGRGASGPTVYQTVDMPLFPGYVFCRFAYTSRLPVLNTPGVTSVVGFCNVPTPVSDDEISRIQAIQASGLPAQPWPYMRVGQRARIERGSLAGLEGVLIREKDSLRVVVSVELLHRAVAVEIGRDMIRAVQGAADATMAHVYLRTEPARSFMTSNPRNRVVVFRLSQDEYRSLKEACERAGARNLSDFTRSEILEYLQSDALSDRLNRRLESLEQRIARMQLQLNSVLQGVLHAEPTPQ